MGTCNVSTFWAATLMLHGSLLTCWVPAEHQKMLPLLRLKAESKRRFGASTLPESS